MSEIWIDIEDASGNKYGAGPIITATGWESTRRLDAAGTFSFRMPASDPRSEILANKRIARCWTVRNGALRELGAGIIDQITISPRASGNAMLEVSGSDILRELANRTISELDLLDENTAAATTVEISYADATPTATVTLPGNVNLDNGVNGPDPLSFLCIVHTKQFAEIDFVLGSTVNIVAGTLIAQYYCYNDDGEYSWENLTNVVDGTAVAVAPLEGAVGEVKPFAQSGSITWDMPADWHVDDRDYYIVRFSCQDKDLSTFTLNSATVHTMDATANALQMIMAYAPPGWTLDAAGEYATATSVYLPAQSGTVLAMLAMLAEQTGEHFALSPSGRRVRWIGADAADSGLRATNAMRMDLDDNVMLITDIEHSADSYDLYTRLYATGGGTGDGKLTLEKTTRVAPVGYVLDKANGYIENTTAQATYGRIDWRETYSDIVPYDVSETAEVDAANTLYDRMYEALSRKSQLQHAYGLSVVPSGFRIEPGETVRVVYDEWVESYHAVAIDANLVVLEVNEQIGKQGVLTAGLTVATVDQWPTNDYRATARAIGKVELERNLTPPQTGFSSVGPGVPVKLAVQGGSIVTLEREIPVADGRYGSVDTITIRNGAIVKINDAVVPL